jgi:hypothetical protein
VIAWLLKRPWLAVVAAFVVLIAAWATLITIAVRNAPEEVPPAHAGKGEAP